MPRYEEVTILDVYTIISDAIEPLNSTFVGDAAHLKRIAKKKYAK